MLRENRMSREIVCDAMAGRDINSIRAGRGRRICASGSRPARSLRRKFVSPGLPSRTQLTMERPRTRRKNELGGQLSISRRTIARRRRRDGVARRSGSALVPVAACLFGALGALGGCDRKPFHGELVLGGQPVSADVLNQGALVFRKNCAACHGESGRGDTDTAASMRPPPRDLTSGLFKFGSAPDNALPTDADLERTLRQGLAGTDMPSFASLTPLERNAVVQYVKTLSPRWRSEKPGQPVAIGADPFEPAQDADAVQRGEVVYHRVAQCWTCHPSYASRASILAMKGDGADGELPWRADMASPRTVLTRYGEDTPPDFLQSTLRSGSTVRDIARAVAAGVGGTPMPSFHSRLSDRDVWAVAHFVRDLVRKRGTPAAAAIRAGLAAAPVDGTATRADHPDGADVR